MSETAATETTTTVQKHPRMLEAIENAKQAAISNRGMYPYTTATNVFMKDGTTLEPREDETTGGDDTGTGEEAEEPGTEAQS